MGTQTSYSGGGGYPGLPSIGRVTKSLLILNLGAFLFFFILRVVSPALHATVFGLFAFSWQGLKQGFIWQPVTYAFAETGVTAALFGGLALYSFGAALERRLGGRLFLALYLTGIFGGALFAMLTQFALTWGKLGNGILFGSQAPLLALVVVFAILFPTATVLFFGIIPMKSKHMALLLVGLALLDAIGQGGQPGNGWHLFPLAHLGGAVAGFFWWKIIRSNKIFIFTRMINVFNFKKRKFKIVADKDNEKQLNEKEYYH